MSENLRRASERTPGDNVIPAGLRRKPLMHSDASRLSGLVELSYIRRRQSGGPAGEQNLPGGHLSSRGCSLLSW